MTKKRTLPYIGPYCQNCGGVNIVAAGSDGPGGPPRSIVIMGWALKFIMGWAFEFAMVSVFVVSGMTFLA